MLYRIARWLFIVWVTLCVGFGTFCVAVVLFSEVPGLVKQMTAKPAVYRKWKWGEIMW